MGPLGKCSFSRITVLTSHRHLADSLLFAVVHVVVASGLAITAMCFPGSGNAAQQLSASVTPAARGEVPTVRFRVGPDVFALSRDYVWAHSGRDGTFVRDPNLRMLFPGMSPVRKDDPLLRQGAWAGGRLVTLVLVESRSTWYEKTLAIVIAESIASGKVRDEEHWSVYFGGPQSGSEVYAPRGSQESSRLVQCTRKTTQAASASCQKYTHVTRSTIAHIRFAKSMLIHSSEIETEIVALLRAALENSP